MYQNSLLMMSELFPIFSLLLSTGLIIMAILRQSTFIQCLAKLVWPHTAAFILKVIYHKANEYTISTK